MSFNCWKISVVETISSQVSIWLNCIRKNKEKCKLYYYNCCRCHKNFQSETEIISKKIRCPECQEKVDKANEKRKKTCLEKYGTENAAQNSEVKAKYINTWKEKYGCMGYFQRGCDQNEIQKLAHSDLAYERKKIKNRKNFGTDWPAQSKEIQKKMQDTYEERTGYRNAMQNPEDAARCHRGKYLYKNIRFDSSWELAVYIWLEDNNKQFTYHPNPVFDYIDDEGITRVYYPDFLIEGKLYEIKGTQFFNDKSEPYDFYNNKYWWGKYNALLEHKVKILKMDDIKLFLRYVKDKYGKNYLKQFKIEKGSETIESSREQVE